MDRGVLPNRRSIRLKGFDYSQNHAYFITICATRRLCLFADVLDGEIDLTPVGEVVAACWEDLPNHAPGLVIDASVVMPNHIHGIIFLPESPALKVATAAAPHGPAPGSLGAIVGGFKSAVSRQVNARNITHARPIWQRNYYERIVRNERELDLTRRYIMENPLCWNDDPNHPRFHPEPKWTRHP